MHTAALLVAVLALAGWSLLAVDILLGRRRMVLLREIAPATAADPMPAVSVVIPARNEEQSLEEALRSVLALDYPRLEVIAVDDRSDDATGEILDRLAASEARLRVEHVTELPDGWLGKNHALQVGGELARGEFLLFTDADVVFEPTALARAMAVVVERRLDHLAVACDVETPGPALELFVSTFALFFNAYFRPWRLGDPKSRAAVGIGAFNLVRASAWRRAGTHRALRMAADDDVRLGRILKQGGARGLFAVAGSLVRVEWYSTLGAAVRGLEKNAVAAVGDSYASLVAGSAAQLLFTAWPFVAVFVTTGPARLVYLASVGAILACHLYLLREVSLRAWTSLALPIGTLLVVFTVLRAALLTRLRGGIEWRGTFYPIDEIRRR